MHNLFAQKNVKLAVDGAARHRSLIRRLESGELGATVAWVNITLLHADGTTQKLFYSALGKVPHGEKPTEQGAASSAGKTDASIAELLRLHKGTDGRFCGLSPLGKLSSQGTYCLPYGDCVLLISCAGFPHWKSNHRFSILIASELDLELHKLTEQPSLSA